MATNTVSEFVPTDDGGLFFYLKQRMPPDPAEFEKNKVEITNQILQRNRQATFQSWVNDLIHQEQVSLGRFQTPAPQPEPEEVPPPETAPTPAQFPAKS